MKLVPLLTPAGSDTQLQYNDGGEFAGDSTLTFNDATKVLSAQDLTLTNPLTVPNGGTGLATVTDGGLMLGSGAGAVTPLAQATNGQIPIGSTGADPVLATITGTANEIDVTNAAGSITIGLVDPLIVAKGGTGLATITDHGVVVGSGTGAVTPVAVGTTDQLLTGNTGADPSFKTATVEIPINIEMFDAVPSRGTESNWNGGLLELDNAAAVNSGAPFVMTTKGSGKIVIVVNAGGDLAGDITLTGTSVDRNTMAQTGAATSVITLTGATTDSSTTDANSNVIHTFTKAYITDKWFTGVVTITTADVAITDMDIFHCSFEQMNDQSNLVLNTFDANIYTTNVAAEFDAYLHTLHVTGDECDIHCEAELHVGAVGGATAQTAQANKYFRLRQGNLAESIDGSTDGFWVDVHYSNSPVYVEDVTIKVWFTKTQPLTMT